MLVRAIQSWNGILLVLFELVFVEIRYTWEWCVEPKIKKMGLTQFDPVQMPNVSKQQTKSENDFWLELQTLTKAV